MKKHFTMKYILCLSILSLAGCAHLGEAGKYYAAGNYSESIRLCREAIASDSTDTDAYALLAGNYLAADSLQRAYRTVTRAAGLNLESPKLTAETGRVFTAMGNRAAAEDDMLRALGHYRRAGQYIPRDTLLLRPLFETLINTGNLTEAEEKLSALRKLGIDTARAAAYAAEIRSRRISASKQAKKGIAAYKTEKLRSAVSLLSHARSLQSDNDTITYYYHLAHGSDLYLRGRFTYKKGAVGQLWDAIEHFGKAAAVFPENAEPHYRMALCYEKKDRDEYTNAIAAYEKALELEPEGPFSAASRKQAAALKARKKKMDRFYGRDK